MSILSFPINSNSLTVNSEKESSMLNRYGVKGRLILRSMKNGKKLVRFYNNLSGRVISSQSIGSQKSRGVVLIEMTPSKKEKKGKISRAIFREKGQQSLRLALGIENLTGLSNQNLNVGEQGKGELIGGFKTLQSDETVHLPVVITRYDLDTYIVEPASPLFLSGSLKRELVQLNREGAHHDAQAHGKTEALEGENLALYFKLVLDEEG